MSRLKAIRMRCIDCGDGGYRDVKVCEFSECPLWKLRYGKAVKGEQPKKVIRKYCVEWCMNGQASEVRLCPSVGCPLYPFRLSQAVHLKLISSEKTPSSRTI